MQPERVVGFFDTYRRVYPVRPIATPHRGSYLTEYPVTEFLGRFLTLPLRIVRTGVELARDAGDFKVNPSNLGSGSLFGMTPNNPVLQTMAATPIAPGVHAHSIIAVAGNGPVEGSDDDVVKYSSSHLEGVDSEYIVRSTHSTQSNPYTIEEVRRILLLHAAGCLRADSLGSAAGILPRWDAGGDIALATDVLDGRDDGRDRRQTLITAQRPPLARVRERSGSRRLTNIAGASAQQRGCETRMPAPATKIAGGSVNFEASTAQTSGAAKGSEPIVRPRRQRYRMVFRIPFDSLPTSSFGDYRRIWRAASDVGALRMDWLTDPQFWASLVTLTALEIVLETLNQIAARRRR